MVSEKQYLNDIKSRLSKFMTPERLKLVNFWKKLLSNFDDKDKQRNKFSNVFYALLHQLTFTKTPNNIRISFLKEVRTQIKLRWSKHVITESAMKVAMTFIEALRAIKIKGIR